MSTFLGVCCCFGIASVSVRTRAIFLFLFAAHNVLVGDGDPPTLDGRWDVYLVFALHFRSSVDYSAVDVVVTRFHADGSIVVVVAVAVRRAPHRQMVKGYPAPQG